MPVKGQGVLFGLMIEVEVHDRLPQPGHGQEQGDEKHAACHSGEHPPPKRKFPVQGLPHLLSLPHGLQGVGLGLFRVPAGLHQGGGVVVQVVLELLGHRLFLFGRGVAEAGADGLDIGHLPGVDTEGWVHRGHLLERNTSRFYGYYT